METRESHAIIYGIMTDIQALIFDVDGTLVDARNDIVSAMTFTRKSLGLEPIPADAVIACVGTGVKDLVRKTMGTGHEGLLPRAFEIFMDYYLKHAADEAVLYPHVRETLEYFGDKRKFVLSNRMSAAAEATLGKMGIAKYFEHIVGADDETCLKPSSCPIDKDPVLSRLDRAAALIIGDMTYDIMAGRAAGIRTCWVTYGLGKREDIMPLKPDFVIDDMIELKKIISVSQKSCKNKTPSGR